MTIFYFTFALLSEVYAGFFSDLVSPVSTDARYFFLPGAVITLGIHSFEDSKLSYEAKQELYHEASNRDRQLAHWGDFLGSGILNGTYFLTQIIAGNSNNCWHIFNATLHSSIATWALKWSVHEKRPSGTNYLSFPSGHTSNAFAFASVVAINHSWPVGLFSIALASYVGYTRIVDNAHWLHDVVAGMVIGTSYGIGTYLNARGAASGSTSKVSFMLMPLPKTYIPGVLFRYAY